MKTFTIRILLAAGCVIVGAAIMFTTPPVGKGDFFDGVFGWIVVAVIGIFAVIDVKEWLADRREHRNAAGNATAIQALPLGEYEDGELATFHFPEDGER